jgi:hypothetical protein
MSDAKRQKTSPPPYSSVAASTQKLSTQWLDQAYCLRNKGRVIARVEKLRAELLLEKQALSKELQDLHEPEYRRLLRDLFRIQLYMPYSEPQRPDASGV